VPGPSLRTVPIARSPVSGEPARLLVREQGRGPAVAVLHGGWGYRVYPFDVQMEALAPRCRAVAPDRVGFGGSGRIAELPEGFQALMARETMLALDALGIERAALWGHSDGAVVAAWCAILFPERVRALALEALHFRAWKPGSIEFFSTGAEDPARFGENIARELEADHGPGWRDVIRMESRAWLRLIEGGRARGGDLFGGRLSGIRCPALLLHGRRDPRTEPGEMDDALAALPGARLAWLEAGHSPHTSATAGPECTRLAVEFLAAAPP
jgi:pimeloyl-ACP methyl ester carboxylesterase